MKEYHLARRDGFGPDLPFRALAENDPRRVLNEDCPSAIVKRMHAHEIERQKLAVLVEDFGKLSHSGGFKGQSEATARTWVERFLSVFGWDPSDPRQVWHEYSIQGRAARRLKAEGTSHRRPDYCLLAHGRRLLSIDVKKIDANIRDDAGIAYQVRCYGWSEGFILSYAFDFEELAVFDCRIRPQDSDESDIARVHYFRFSEYLDNFGTLWDLFSREAIESGSLERRFPADARPKGSKTLDQDFQENLSRWRKELAKSILRYGKTREVAILSAAAQRILDRIILLRICEELGLEELGSLLEMGQHKDGFWDLFLKEHDARYAKVYDGILFPSSGEQDSSGVDDHLRSWWLKGRIFREIVQSLEWMPSQYRYLKESGAYETTAQGKTDYGALARACLLKQKAISEIEDFRDLQVFADRTTYTAILVLAKESHKLHYRTYSTLLAAIAARPSVECDIEWPAIDDGVWAFDQPDLMDVHRDLVRRHGTIGDRPELSISVGLQTLYGKLYQFEPVEDRARTVVGRNGEGEEVTLEKAAFRANNTDAWVIFPYDVADGSFTEISWREFKERFPKTAGYLEERKRMLLKAVEGEDCGNRWHLYKYPKTLWARLGPR